MPETAEEVLPLAEPTVVWVSVNLREQLKHLEMGARQFVKDIKSSSESLSDQGECIAQAMLALRHIEDARMRFGKVIQYANTGESIYGQ